MVHDVYFSPVVNDLYKQHHSHCLDSSNQSIYVVSPLHDLLQKCTQAMTEMSTLLHKQQTQQNVSRKKIYRLGTINQSLYDLQRNIQILTDNQRDLFDFLKENIDNHENEHDTFTSDKEREQPLQESTGNIENRNGIQEQLLNQSGPISENDKEEYVPFRQFQLGDRITIMEANGLSSSGVFIEADDNSIIWVDDSTNRLSFINKKGITIQKEF